MPRENRIIMLIKADTRAFATAINGKGWDYPLPTEDIGISYQEYDGKAPDHGRWINTVCWEAYFIIDGTATIEIDSTTYEAQARDLLVILPGQKVRMTARQLKLLTITKPNWYESQAKITDE